MCACLLEPEREVFLCNLTEAGIPTPGLLPALAYTPVACISPFEPSAPQPAPPLPCDPYLHSLHPSWPTSPLVHTPAACTSSLIHIPSSDPQPWDPHPHSLHPPWPTPTHPTCTIPSGLHRWGLPQTPWPIRLLWHACPQPALVVKALRCLFLPSNTTKGCHVPHALREAEELPHHLLDTIPLALPTAVGEGGADPAFVLCSAVGTCGVFWAD